MECEEKIIHCLSAAIRQLVRRGQMSRAADILQEEKKYIEQIQG